MITGSLKYSFVIYYDGCVVNCVTPYRNSAGQPNSVALQRQFILALLPPIEKKVQKWHLKRRKKAEYI